VHTAGAAVYRSLATTTPPRVSPAAAAAAAAAVDGAGTQPSREGRENAPEGRRGRPGCTLSRSPGACTRRTHACTHARVSARRAAGAGQGNPLAHSSDLARYRSRRRLATIYRMAVANPLKRELISSRREEDSAHFGAVGATRRGEFRPKRNENENRRRSD